MNPRLVHLKKRGEFLRVASARRKFVTPSLILQARPHDESDAEDIPPVRVGFTVSRRVGDAVVRNRVRRRLRAAAEEIMPDYADANSDFVIIGRTAARGQEYTSLTGHLKSALAKYEIENNKQKPNAE